MKSPVKSFFCRITIILLLFINCNPRIFAQAVNKDSLISLIRATKNDTIKIRALDDLAWELAPSKPDTSILIGTQALQMSEALIAGPRKDRLISSICRSLGVFNSMQGNYPKALQLYFKALEISERYNDKKEMSATLGNIGIVYYDLEDLPKALKYYNDALKIAEELGSKTGIASDLANIGNIYRDQKNYPKAEEYMVRALKIAEELGDNYIITTNLGNLGTVYKNLGNYSKAMDYYTRAMEISRKMGDNYNLSAFYGNIGGLDIELGKYKEAEEYLTKALSMSTELKGLILLKSQEESMSLLYSLTGRPELALEHYKKFIVARDSLSNEEYNRKSILSEMKFEFEKKEALAKVEQEKKDLLSASELKEQKKQRNYFIFGFALVFLLAIFIFANYRQKQKANILIGQQKKEVEKQKHLVEQKHKEITDSINYAERIQRSFLATAELLKENLDEHFVLFQPKAVVSGDFYWASVLKSGRFVFVTADSTGHGVPGAIMSILNISCLEKAIEGQQLTEPAAILDHTRLKIIERLNKDGSEDGGKDGMDCCLICFDKKHSKLTYAAAHIPLWIVRGKEVLEFDSDKMPVGKHDRDNIPFTQRTVDLQKDDMMYIITDGFPDQFGGPFGKKFMHKRLKEALVLIAHLPVETQKENLLTIFSDWKGNIDQVDDITVVGIRV